MFKPIFPYILVMIMPFPGFERLSVAKNTNATFFGSEEVIVSSQKNAVSSLMTCLKMSKKKTITDNHRHVPLCIMVTYFSEVLGNN
jgi:hypothetical protein